MAASVGSRASCSAATNATAKRRLDMSAASSPVMATAAARVAVVAPAVDAKVTNDADQLVVFGKHRAISWGTDNVAMIALVSCCDSLDVQMPTSSRNVTTTASSAGVAAVARPARRSARSNPDPSTFVCSRHRCAGFKGPFVSKNGEQHSVGRKFFVCPRKGRGAADCFLDGGFRWEDGSRAFSEASCRRAEQFHGLPTSSVVASVSYLR
eukprot:SAG31_NODE_5903_length_2264_cov_1.843880_1_plen_210_part_00